MTTPDSAPEQPPTPEEASRPPEDAAAPEANEAKPVEETSAKPGKRRKRAKKAPIDLSKVADSIQPEAPAPGPDADGAPSPADDTSNEEVPDDESSSAGAPGSAQPAAAGETEPTPPSDDAPAATEVDKPKKKKAEKPDDPVREAQEASLRAAVEAIIFAADDPVTPQAIAKAIGDVKPSAVKKAIDQLRKQREESMSGIAVEEIAGGWTMLTNEEYAPAIRRLRKATESRKLTGAALETLAVVAYKQPIQKQEIEDIRGVSCGPILRTLMEQNLVKIAGRAEALGRPLLYATTKRFLDVFGIASLKDLPKISELSRS